MSSAAVNSQVGLYETLRRQGVEKRLAFPREEYERRIAGVRRRMEERGLDAVLITNTANACYATGYDSCMPPAYGVVVVPLKGSVLLHCSEIEAPVGLYHSVVDDIAIFDWHDASDTATELAAQLRERGLANGRLGLELVNAESFASGAFEAGSYVKLTELLPDAELVDSSDIVLEERLIKSEAELDYMRRAGEYTAAALDASIEATHEGVNENEIVAAAYQAAAALGSETMSIDPMLMSGPRTGLMPHLPYRRNVVNAGDTVYMEYTGTYWRYNAPSMRSTVIGPPSARVQKLADTAIEVLRTIQREARPGRTGHDVAAIADKLWERTPGVYYHGGYGYAIGMGSQPTWTEGPTYIALGAERELRPGMCFHLPICVLYPGELGLGFSESIVITEDGCEQLTPVRPCELVVR